MPSRRELLLGLGALALPALAACSRSGATSSGAKVKLALNWVPEPEFGGFFAAREGGAYARAGLDVDIIGGGAGVPVLQQVSAGRVEFATAGADEVVNANARGADLVAVFAVFQKSASAIMVHASAGAKSMADALSDGVLAIDVGAPYALFLKKKYGFDRVRVVPYDGGVARFAADKAFRQQCYVTSEPLAAKRLGSDPQTFLVADEGYDPYAVVVTRRALWKEKPELVKSFVRASREGWRAYLDDPRATDAVLAKLNPALDGATLDAVAEVQKPFVEGKPGELGRMTKERWETLGKQLFDLGLLDKAPGPVDYVVSVE